MTELNKKIKEICEKEGKKSQVFVGNMREIFSILAKDIAKDLHNNGHATMPPAFQETSFTRAIMPTVNKELARLEKAAAKEAQKTRA